MLMKMLLTRRVYTQHICSGLPINNTELLMRQTAPLWSGCTHTFRFPQMHKVEQIHVDINSRKRRRIALATSRIYSV